MPNTPLPDVLMLIASSEQLLPTRAEGVLRNRGWQARTAWAQDLDDVEEILVRSEPDLVLCDSEQDVAAICGLSRQLSPELPVIVVRAHPDETDDLGSRHEAFLAGAADLVTLDEGDCDHFADVCLREFNASRTSLALREARMRLAEYESRQRTLVAETSRALIGISEGIVVEANPAAVSLLDFDDEDGLIGQPLLDLVTEDSCGSLRDQIARLVKRKAISTECRIAFPVGERRVEAQAHLSVRQSNTDTEIHIDIALREDTTSTASPETESPSGMASEPPANHGDARMQIVRAIERAIGMVGAGGGVLYACIDDFASHEQRLGLVHAGRLADTWFALLAETLPDDTAMFRIDVAEAVAIIRADDVDALENCAATLCREVASQNFKTEAFECHVTNSASVYPLGETDAGSDDILRECCAEARNLSTTAGNSSCSIGATARAAAEERKAREAAEDIRAALQDKHRFKFAYQRISCLGDDQRQIYDVLVRMSDHSGNEIHARDFLPIAERFGLMGSIDEWVVQRALQTVRKRKDTMLMIRLSENTLVDSDAVIAALEANPPPPSTLAVQMRESLLQHQIGRATALQSRLAELGVAFVVDYFGDSQSAASLLDHLHVDYIKVAPRFATEFGDPAVHERLEALIKAARSHEARIIIPFIENTRIMGELWQMGINYVQGNGIQQAEVFMLSTEQLAH